MKKLLGILIGLCVAVSALAQTAEQILTKMDEQMTQHESEGVIMTVETKIPIIGTIRMKSYMLGDKLRMETTLMGASLIIWDDGITEYTYNSKANEITIDNGSGGYSDDSGDLDMFSGITDGYTVSIKKETADAWYILCKKNKDNTNKEDPKNMDVVVAKGTYYPVSLSAKMDGVTMIMKDISFGVTQEQVTFNLSKYPDAKIIDKRNEPKKK
jgi:hypothetical protein